MLLVLPKRLPQVPGHHFGCRHQWPIWIPRSLIPRSLIPQPGFHWPKLSRATEKSVLQNHPKIIATNEQANHRRGNAIRLQKRDRRMTKRPVFPWWIISPALLSFRTISRLPIIPARVGSKRDTDELGGEMIEGTVTLRFDRGQKRANVHVPFFASAFRYSGS